MACGVGVEPLLAVFFLMPSGGGGGYNPAAG
jgi:hypothetical protein